MATGLLDKMERVRCWIDGLMMGRGTGYKRRSDGLRNCMGTIYATHAHDPKNRLFPSKSQSHGDPLSPPNFL